MRLTFALMGNKKGDWPLVPISVTTGGLNSAKYFSSLGIIFCVPSCLVSLVLALSHLVRCERTQVLAVTVFGKSVIKPFQ